MENLIINMSHTNLPILALFGSYLTVMNDFFIRKQWKTKNDL